MKHRRIVLAAAVAAAALPALTASPATAKKPSGPTAVAAQFAETPWDCHPQKFQASGRSGRHVTKTGWLPLFKPPLATYTTSFDGVATRCNGKTRISYHVYIDATPLPSSRYVNFFLQSAGVHKKWKNACVKVYNSDKVNCLFRVDGGKEYPLVGARPIYQYRGDGVVRYLRIRTGALDTAGGGNGPAGKPNTITVKLSDYKKQPKAIW